MSLYERQEELGIIQDQVVMVIGCGGVGSWVGYFLGLAGVKVIELYDSDVISEHNLNRLPFTPDQIGEYKSVALANLISKARKDITVRAFGNFDPDAHKSNLLEADAVVVSTDSLKSRRMVYTAITEGDRFVRYYEVGADGHGASISGSPPDWSSPLEDEPGYASVPVHVGPCTIAASMASYYVLLGNQINETIRVDWQYGEGLKIKQYSERVEEDDTDPVDEEA